MSVEKAYELAKARYAAFGIDTDKMIERALELPISLHCWQADDVVGFETKPDGLAGGGIMATGNYPGRARDGKEARADIAKAMSLIPGTQRCNVHALYCETDEYVDRDEMTPAGFQKWMDWAKEEGIKLDFNPSFFAHPKAEDGALVMQLAEAFGGINYMTDTQREFIENWEVESYRQKQM